MCGRRSCDERGRIIPISGSGDSKRSIDSCLPGNSQYFEKNIRDQWGEPGVQRSLGEQRHFVYKPNTNALADALMLGHLGHRTGGMW